MNENLDPQNLLLLYLADELSPGQRQSVEQMLVEQPPLKTALERLQSAQQTVDLAFVQLDAASGPLNSDATVRRVGRALRQELARPRTTGAGERLAAHRRAWPWLLPSAAAASILVAAAIWIDRHVGVTNPPGRALVDTRFTTEPSTQSTEPERPDDNVALWLDSTGSDLANSRRVEDDIATVADSQDPVSQYMLSFPTSRG